MNKKFYTDLNDSINHLQSQGLYKDERIISSPQASLVEVAGTGMLNFCANNYLGLANDEELVKFGQKALEKYGYGMASVRFICGTQDVHKQLENSISEFLGMEDTILYSSCFDANGGLFETILNSEDAVISDSLNHASIIDGIRLCKAQRYRYRNNDMQDLEDQLKKANSNKVRYKLIATDGVFSMDGIIANLKSICTLADKYQALVMVDDSHAVGFMGQNGRGTPEYCEVMERVDILTGTLGKALGGASGGYTSGKKPLINWLRNRSRPYLFSNTLCPMIAATSIKVFEKLTKGEDLRQKLWQNSNLFREKMQIAGFKLAGKDHPIIPVMLGDAKVTKQFAEKMLKKGVYVTGFSYPVVPQDQARIRVQISAIHTTEQINKVVEVFMQVGKELQIISE